MPSGVRAARATTAARMPLVTHIFVPLTTKSWPSGSARQRMARVSEPASGSDREKQARASPDARRGRSDDRCSGVPCFSINVAQIVCELRMPASDIQPYDSSSMRRAYVGTSRPSPP